MHSILFCSIFILSNKQTKTITMKNLNKTFGRLQTGSVVNFMRGVTGEDYNLVVLGHNNTEWGLQTELLNLDTYEKDYVWSTVQIDGNLWHLVKEQ